MALFGANIGMDTTVVIIFCLVIRAHAGDFYCQNGATVVNEISSQTGLFYHRVIPQLDGANSTKGIKCNWHFNFKLNKDSVLVLNGFDVGNADLNLKRRIRSVGQPGTKVASMDYYLGPPFGTDQCTSDESRKWEPVELETLLILPLKKISHLYIRFELSEGKYHDHSTAGLTIQVMVQGQCSTETEIVNYDHNCYISIPTKRSLVEELALNYGSSITQMASFGSATELQNFVEQSRRRTVGSGLSTRSQVPLNLTQPVRIGLFFDSKNKKVYYLSTIEGVCKIKAFLDADRLLHTVRSSNGTVTCGSLKIRYSAHVAVAGVDFGDCSEPLPTLISFGDTVRDQCINCSLAVLSLLKLSTSPTSVQNKETDSMHQVVYIPNLMFAMIGIGAVITVLLVCLIFVIILRKGNSLQTCGDGQGSQHLELSRTTSTAHVENEAQNCSLNQSEQLTQSLKKNFERNDAECCHNNNLSSRGQSSRNPEEAGASKPLLSTN